MTPDTASIALGTTQPHSTLNASVHNIHSQVSWTTVFRTCLDLLNYYELLYLFTTWVNKVQSNFLTLGFPELHSVQMEAICYQPQGFFRQNYRFLFPRTSWNGGYPNPPPAESLSLNSALGEIGELSICNYSVLVADNLYTPPHTN